MEKTVLEKVKNPEGRIDVLCGGILSRFVQTNENIHPVIRSMYTAYRGDIDHLIHKYFGPTRKVSK